MKKATKSVLAAALVTSSIVPVMSVAAAEVGIADIIVVKDGNSYKVSMEDYEKAVARGTFNLTIQHVVVNGVNYEMDEYERFVARHGDEALNELVKSGTPVVVELSEGTFDPSTGEITPGEEAGDLKVEDVSAINKTTVQVTLNKAVDSVTATNFTIEGGNVTAASLADDKKTVTLSVSGLDYDKAYTVAAKGILVNGEAKDFGSKAFKSPAVTDLWELKILTSSPSLIADGADNLQVTFNLISKETGAIDKDADNIVLDLNTTHGTLASKRVTVQNGTATVLLTSEFSNTNINAKIDAQIIEASGDYKDLIGKVVSTLNVPFVTSTTENVDTLTLVTAEANQADRITLFFDKEASLKHFVKTNAKGELLYNIAGGAQNVTAENIPANTAPDKISHAFKVAAKSVEIAQGVNTNFKVQGFKPVAGNSKAIEVILDKTTVLKDNAAVKVDVVAVNSLGKETVSSADFKVTDARKPEATAVNVEGLNTLKVKFSEAIADASFQIDGRFVNPTHFTYSFGEFNPATLVDNRDLATIVLTAGYDEDGILDSLPTNKTLAGYFSAGKHTLQISSTKDFAFATDSNNLGTTQNLNFTIAADAAKPAATVTVESPEQIRLKFDKALSVPNAAAVETMISNGNIQLQFLDTDGEFKDVDTRTAGEGKVDKTTDYKVVQVSASEYVVQLKKDWTVIYGTNNTNKNYYNDKFRLFIKKNAVTSVTNGLTNDEIKLDLNYAGSPLNSPDTTSPVINTIDRVASSSNFNVTMSEPVKLAGALGTPANETLAQGQGTLQETTVQFLGKDKNGATVTINGSVEGYADKNAADKVLDVKWDNVAVTPQTVVDAGGSEDWTIVIRSISDDVGNTAASATKDFKIAKSASTNTPFFVEKYAVGTPKAGKHMVEGKGNANAADTVEITFSEGVQFSGLSDATNPANYTLNGVTLPAGTSISIVDVTDGSATHASAEGFEKVIITLKDGTLNLGGNVSNVITINKNLVSYDGSKIQGDTEIIVNVDENIASADLAIAQAAIDAITAPTTPTIANFTLPVTSNTQTVTWTSNNAAVAVAGANATVTQPSFAAGDATVTLTASVTVNGQTVTKDYTVVVTKEAASTNSTLTGSTGFVVGGSVGSETLTIATGVTFAQLKAGISVDALATYKVMDGATEVTVDNTVITAGNTVVVTAEDGTTVSTYTIAN